MEIIVNNKVFRTHFQVRRYISSLPNGEVIMITINDKGKTIYHQAFNSADDVKIKCIMFKFWHCGELVLCDYAYSSQQACDLIDKFFNKYGAFNYEIREDYYVNGKLIDGTFTF
ncbi:MAG: hypothetical protein K6F12_05180 [Streptococcus sp.]|uniref:hypothetical protein n=1 Tax=Streptococcus sp. TaxID=1306 RepID=UPI00258D89B1|nr:hypothetical protein [Streptococcus sp.]MCR5493041.1 hypothetical protein [Streptococcus sp.]